MKITQGYRTSWVWRADRDYWVYKHVSGDGAVLYVGCTTQMRAREATHRRSSHWYARVAETQYEGPFDRETGFDRKLELIRSLDPPNNMAGTARDPRLGNLFGAPKATS